MISTPDYDEFFGYKLHFQQVQKILQQLFPHSEIRTQVPIENLICLQDFNLLDIEFQNHKFDMVVYNGPHILAVEVNYKHKEKATRKWEKVFTKILKNNNKIPITIDDYNCETLFLDPKKKIKNPWGSYIDVIRELQRQKVTLDGSLQ